MSDTIAAPAPPDHRQRQRSEDERLAYRGVFQRLFVRPEIGALIGVVGIWVFFWAATVPFGTANGASNIIDYASTLGIMAVAVSMLMIGGEFDLSAGAMTGRDGHPRRSCCRKRPASSAAPGSIWHRRSHLARGGARYRLHERLAGREDQAPELHDHARHLLRADRRQARLLQVDRRPDPGRRHQRRPGLRVLAQGVRRRVGPPPTSSRLATRSTPSSASSA